MTRSVNVFAKETKVHDVNLGFFSFQLFSDAESSFAQVLKLDKHCEDAMFELARVRMQQLEVRQ